MEKGRVLIVDDEPTILHGLSELFGQEYAVFTSASAERALTLLQSERIEVVVSDYKMPGMDGLSFLIEVRRRHPQIVRILMTAYADMQLVIRAMNEGEVHRFIAKPYKASELSTMITARSRGGAGRCSSRTIRWSARPFCGCCWGRPTRS
jgi:DNA-binding NtrC family response regulator